MHLLLLGFLPLACPRCPFRWSVWHVTWHRLPRKKKKKHMAPKRWGDILFYVRLCITVDFRFGKLWESCFFFFFSSKHCKMWISFLGLTCTSTSSNHKRNPNLKGQSSHKYWPQGLCTRALGSWTLYMLYLYHQLVFIDGDSLIWAAQKFRTKPYICYHWPAIKIV